MSGDKYTLKFPSVGDTISIAKRRRSLEKYRLPESRKRKQIEESKVVYEQESEREIEDEKELEQHQNEEEGDGDGNNLEEEDRKVPGEQESERASEDGKIKDVNELEFHMLEQHQNNEEGDGDGNNELLSEVFIVDGSSIELQMDNLQKKIAEWLSLHESFYPDSEALIVYHQLLDLPSYILSHGPVRCWWAYYGERVLSVVRQCVKKGGQSWAMTTMNSFTRVEDSRLQDAYSFDEQSIHSFAELD